MEYMEPSRSKPNNINSPRTITATFYAFLSLMAAILYQFGQLWVNPNLKIPLLPGLLLAVILALCCGALLGKRICQANSRTQCFLYGVALSLLFLFFYDFLLLFFIKEIPSNLNIVNNSFKGSFAFYCYVLIYSFMIFGSWLCMLSGLAALYLKNNYIFISNGIYQKLR